MFVTAAATGASVAVVVMSVVKVVVLIMVGVATVIVRNADVSLAGVSVEAAAKVIFVSELLAIAIATVIMFVSVTGVAVDMVLAPL